MSQFLASQPVGVLVRADGKRETSVITMPAVGAATQGDYVIVNDANDDSTACYIDIDDDGTAPTGALYVAADTKTSVAYVNAVNETYIVTSPSTAGATQADYLMIYNDSGTAYAVWIDIDAAGTVPTGALYVGSDNKITAGIATGDSAAQAGTKIFTAIDGNVTDVSFTDNLDGTITVLLDNAGPATDSVPKNADDSGAGSITVGTITDGVTATTAIAGGTALGSITSPGIVITDNADATATAVNSDVGNSTDTAVKDDDDAGAGSITTSNTDGAAEKTYRYHSASASPSTYKNDPDLIS